MYPVRRDQCLYAAATGREAGSVAEVPGTSCSEVQQMYWSGTLAIRISQLLERCLVQLMILHEFTLNLGQMISLQ